MKQRIPSAADDLGLTEEARAEYKRRLSWMFAEGCAIFGARATAKFFRDQAKASQKGPPAPPPRKRKGPHDPEGDRYLLQLWNTTSSGKTKRAFAQMALKNHAVKIGGKVRRQDKMEVDSMVRRLNRILKRASETLRPRA